MPETRTILGLLQALRERFGKTVVMVTHDDRALRYVDEVHRLDKGELLVDERRASPTERGEGSVAGSHGGAANGATGAANGATGAADGAANGAV
jgi:energy-coupling factor transporter ATP-binding protein EcfA2